MVSHKEETTAATLSDLFWRPPAPPSVSPSALFLCELLVKAPVVFPQSVHLSPLVEPDCSVPPSFFSAHINLDEFDLVKQLGTEIITNNSHQVLLLACYVSLVWRTLGKHRH